MTYTSSSPGPSPTLEHGDRAFRHPSVVTQRPRPFVSESGLVCQLGSNEIRRKCYLFHERSFKYAKLYEISMQSWQNSRALYINISKRSNFKFDTIQVLIVSELTIAADLHLSRQWEMILDDIIMT